MIISSYFETNKQIISSFFETKHLNISSPIKTNIWKTYYKHLIPGGKGKK